MSFVILYDVSLRDFAALEHARRTSLFGKVVIPTTRCVKDRSLPTVFNTNNTQKTTNESAAGPAKMAKGDTDTDATCCDETRESRPRDVDRATARQRDSESGPNAVTISEYRF